MPEEEVSGRTLRVVRDPLPLGDLRSLPFNRHRRLCRAWLADGGGELVLATARGRWLFLWVADLESGVVRRRVSLRAPERLEGATGGHRLSISQDGDRLWVVGREGVLALSSRGWRVTGWRPYRREIEDQLGSREWLEWARVLPGTSYLWLNLGRSFAVRDLESWRLERRPFAPDFFYPMLRPGGTLAVVMDGDDRPRLFRADGAPVVGADLPPAEWLWSQAVAPDGRGFVQLTLHDCPDDDWGRQDLRLMWLRKGATGSYRRAPRAWVRGLTGEDLHHIVTRVVTSLDVGLCFVLTEVDHQKLVVAFALGDDGFRELYRFPVHYTAELVQDRDSWCVALVWADESGVQVLRLGPEPPPGPVPRARAPWFVFPSYDGDVWPPHHEDEDIELRVWGYMKQVCRLDDEGVEVFCRRFEGGNGEDPETLVLLGYAITWEAGSGLLEASDARRLERLRGWIGELLAEHHGEHPAAALFLAREEAMDGRWRSAWRWLEVAAAGELDREQTEHLHHLRGLALVHDRRPDEAYLAFAEAARQLPGGRWFDRLMAVTQPMSDPPEPAEWGPDQPPLRRLLGAIRTADAARRAGDVAAGLAALDQRLVWAFSELQSFGRFAALALQRPLGGRGGDLQWPAPTEAERFHKRLVLAHFCRFFGDWKEPSRVLEMPGFALDREEVERVAERARAWLEEEAESPADGRGSGGDQGGGEA